MKNCQDLVAIFKEYSFSLVLPSPKIFYQIEIVNKNILSVKGDNGGHYKVDNH